MAKKIPTNDDGLERITENSVGVMRYLQESKHDMLRQYITEKDILDIGCGSGYSLQRFSSLYKSAVGIDLNTNAIEYAKTNNILNAIFFVQDVQGFNLEGKTFDLIYSMDVIEHLENIPSYLDSINKHLNDDGLFICSTPNVEETKNINPHHIIEFTQEGFLEVLNRHLSVNELFVQEKNDRSALLRFFWIIDVFKLRKFLPKSFCDFGRRIFRIPLFEELSVKHYPITKNYSRAYSFIAVCSKK
jgi:2-polyprenyl-3-methyl-5-hydroxy-6-metoxy-1,4-benzoquinol methylase